MKDSATALERLLNTCEKAMWAKKPLLFLQTDELEIVRRVVESDRLVVRMAGKTEEEERYFPFRDLEREDDSRSPGQLVDIRVKNVTYLREPSCFLASHFSKWTVRSTRTEGLPRLFVLRMPTKANEPGGVGDDWLDGLVAFVDQYQQEKDDNSALRGSLILIYGHCGTLPRALQPYCEIIDIPFPQRGEVLEIIHRELDRRGLPDFADKDDLERLTAALCGFSTVEIERNLRYFLNTPDEDGYPAIYSWKKIQELLYEQKQQMLKRDQILELVVPKTEEIGGMTAFTDWLKEQKSSLLEADKLLRETGVTAPKGVLMCGIPGCGKSMAVQSLATQLNLPLLKLDVGQLMGRFVGESEHNMIRALRLTEAMSPCILWIDELDKAFGSLGGSEDGGVLKRMFGTLLTWMQDNIKPCFIFATANSITGMPKEFFRSGRFDALFALYMPTYEECVDILKKRMEATSRKVLASKGEPLFCEACFGRQYLAELFRGLHQTKEKQRRFRFMTGADIEKLVNIALRSCWRQGNRNAITMGQWDAAMLEAIQSTTVFGDGPENMDSITVTYLRLLRNNFQTAANRTVFLSDDYALYKDEQGFLRAKTNPLPEERRKAMDEYDAALYEAVAARIPELAPRLESNIIQTLVH